MHLSALRTARAIGYIQTCIMLYVHLQVPCDLQVSFDCINLPCWPSGLVDPLDVPELYFEHPSHLISLALDSIASCTITCSVSEYN